MPTGKTGFRYLPGHIRPPPCPGGYDLRIIPGCGDEQEIAFETPALMCARYSHDMTVDTHDDRGFLVGYCRVKAFSLGDHPVRYLNRFTRKSGIRLVARRISVHDDQGRYLFAVSLELHSDLVGDDAPERPAQQMVRAGFLHGADLLDVFRCHLPYGARRLACTVEAAGLQPVQRLIRGHVPR